MLTFIVNPDLLFPDYEPEAEAYFAAMSTQPTGATKTIINDLVRALKDQGLFARLQWLSVALHDGVDGGAAAAGQAYRVNLINPAQVGIFVNAPAFTIQRGMRGDAVTSYMDTQVAGTNVDPVDASMAALARLRGTLLRSIMGYRTARHLIAHGGAVIPRGNLVTGTQSIATTASADGQFVCLSRTGTTQTIQVETAVEDTDTVATDLLSSTNTIRVGADSVSFSDAELFAAAFGRHLDNTDANNLRTILRDAATAVGAL